MEKMQVAYVIITINNVTVQVMHLNRYMCSINVVCPINISLSPQCLPCDLLMLSEKQYIPLKTFMYVSVYSRPTI